MVDDSVLADVMPRRPTAQFSAVAEPPSHIDDGLDCDRPTLSWEQRDAKDGQPAASLHFPVVNSEALTGTRDLLRPIRNSSRRARRFDDRRET